MGCTTSKTKCIRLKKLDSWSAFSQSPGPTDGSWSSGLTEIPSRLRNASDVKKDIKRHPCVWAPEMGPMTVWMDISIDNLPQPRLVVTLLPHLAPRACENFRYLMKACVGSGYKRSLFHEIEPGIQISGGQFPGVSVFGGRFKDEISLDQPTYARYNLFMASTGPNSNNIEFFICLGDNDFRTCLSTQLHFLLTFPFLPH